MKEQSERTPIGGRITIYARGKKKTYVADFWSDGVHRRLSLKTNNKKEAIRRATKLAAELDAGTFHQPPPTTTLRQAADDYLTHLRTERRADKTLVKYEGVLKLFTEFVSRNGVARLARVTARHFDSYRAGRAQTKHPKTTYCDAMILKGLFKWAKSRRLISENPLADIRLAKPPLEPKGGPSLEQVDQLINAAAEPLRSQIAVLAFAGMRSGELQRLRPEDIDLNGNWIYIVSRPGAETKTRASRKVPIHPRLKAVLERLSSNRRPWLFTAAPSSKYPKGDHHINVKRLNDQFVRLASKLRLPTGRKDGFVIHSLRHFFETFCVNAGIPQRVIDTWLGHRSDNSMAAVYYRLGDDDSQSFMIKVPFGTGLPAAVAGQEMAS